MNQISEVKQIYERGGNIMDFLRAQANESHNSVEAILISYDFQAGTYINFVQSNPEFAHQYTGAISKILDQFQYSSLMEAGVGEATTLGNVVERLKNKPEAVYGFDLSWSRIRFGQKYLEEKQINGNLFTGNLFTAPIADNAIDVVYTSHSIEPNGGKEREALMELHRITNKYLVLLEPAYEFADDDGKKRMEKLGYVRDLYKVAKDLGYKVVEYRKFDYSSNALNPTGVMVIEKDPKESDQDVLVCPISKTPLRLAKSVYYSKDSCLAYPIVAGVPCLLPDNAILATHFNDF
jgi:uncharacterized protein YbaR (Trm112 family)